MTEAVFDALKRNGSKYVRWAFCGSDDQGGIVEIKIFDYAAVELSVFPISSCCGATDNLKNELIKLGEKILEADCRGYEINDGGYGWILLDVEDESFWIKRQQNNQGMGSEYFDERLYDRIEFEVEDEPSELMNPLDLIKVTYRKRMNDNVKKPKRVTSSSQTDTQDMEIDFERKSAFLTWEHVPKRSVRQGRVEADIGAHTIFKINGHALAETLRGLAIPAADMLYYKTNDDFSHSPAESLSVIRFCVYEHSCGEKMATIFLNGWQEGFLYDSPGGDDLVKLNPTPIAILGQR